MAMIPLLVQLSGGRLCHLPDPDTSRDRFPDHSVDGIFCTAGAQLDAAGGVPGRAGVDRALIVSEHCRLWACAIRSCASWGPARRGWSQRTCCCGPDLVRSAERQQADGLRARVKAGLIEHRTVELLGPYGLADSIIRRGGTGGHDRVSR
jgi:hypothetical protein